MTAALATREGLPGRLRDDGYDLPANLPYERWLEIGETLQQIERSVKWWLGDWWNYGERAYREMASQASKDHVEDITGYAYHTVVNAAAVAKKFEPSRRREHLSWSHHDAVAALPLVDAEALLDDAESDGLNVFAVRDRARERKKEIAGRSLDANGDAPDDPPMRWVPGIEDLTDEARTALEVHAPGGRHRQGYVAGFVAALVYAHQTDCFKEWRDG